MIGSMFVGLSGMNAYSNGLRQISNNITNLNSTGFKASTTQFGDLVRSGQIAGGSRDGQGVTLRDSRTDFGQGELRQTNRGLDLAVDGAGFLVLLRPDGQTVLARTGSFEVNSDGFVVLAGTDLRLATLGSNGQPVAVSLAGQRFSAPQPTTRVKFSGNLSSTSSTGTHAIPLNVFDRSGDSLGWQAVFTLDRASISSNPASVEWTIEVRNGANTALPAQRLRFENGLPTAATSTMTFTDDASGLTVTFDFSQGVTPFSNGDRSDLAVAQNGSDGRDRGDLTGVSINQDGELLLTYSNQESRVVGDIALAMPADAQQLGELGQGLFRVDDLRGIAFTGSAQKGAGRVLSNRLEASNVDLARQFGELILIQRGYQASSQIVSASNEMIQQLFALRGQG